MQAFQKTSAYRVLMIAGLHVGAIIVFLLWLGPRLRLGRLARRSSLWLRSPPTLGSLKTERRFFVLH